tara:strand:+ start:215 stop:442 length:228 start_codon:yes stop_codon:yes gene_type:complete
MGKIKAYLLNSYDDENEGIKFNNLLEVRIALLERYCPELNNEDVEKVRKMNTNELANQFDCKITVRESEGDNEEI